VANVAAIGAVLTGASSLIPSPVERAVELMGSAAVPVATFILGAVLGGVPLRLRPYLADASRVLLVKLMLLPALVITVLVNLPEGLLDPLLARFLVIEAAAAPAAGIILMVRSYGGDETKIGSLMLASYAMCTLTLPLWVSIWSLLEH
jgi:predicted permease